MADGGLTDSRDPSDSDLWPQEAVKHRGPAEPRVACGGAPCRTWPESWPSLTDSSGTDLPKVPRPPCGASLVPTNEWLLMDITHVLTFFNRCALLKGTAAEAWLG